jgi:hypothetical protein
MNYSIPIRLLAEVTFHYNERRLHYLFQVVRALCGLPLESLTLVVSTNTDDASRLQRIRSLCEPLLAGALAPESQAISLTTESHPKLEDPWHLPWCHKHLITDTFLADGSPFTHFIHLEDDLLFSLNNLLYFVRYSEALRPHRLIPSFQRIELDPASSEFRLVDQNGLSEFGARSNLRVEDFVFVNPDYPHQAMIVLDKEMAEEYVASRSFDRLRSTEVRADWGLCERASMGLCFESPPEGYWSRYVIPLHASTSRLASSSWIYHLPNNYSANPRTPLGKTRPEQLFDAPPDSYGWTPPTLGDKVVWRAERLRGRLLHGPKKTGHDLVPSQYCGLCGVQGRAPKTCERPSCPSRGAGR